MAADVGAKGSAVQRLSGRPRRRTSARAPIVRSATRGTASRGPAVAGTAIDEQPPLRRAGSGVSGATDARGLGLDVGSRPGAPASVATGTTITAVPASA